MDSNLDLTNSNADLNNKRDVCKFCNAPLPANAKNDFCQNCQDRILFMEVKDYIRANDVNEFQVAAHFGIPLRMVKGWIKEGRIEYKEDVTGKHIVANLHCSGCGAPITFGTLCSKCLKLVNRNMQGFGKKQPTEEDKMRFLSNELERI